MFGSFPRTHLGEAQPQVTVGGIVFEAKPDLRGFIRVEEEVLVSGRHAVGLDGAVVVIVHVHVQPPDVLAPLVKVDSHPGDVLRIIEVVVDPAPLFAIRAREAVSLARPARVPAAAIVVPSVLGYAAVRAASIVRGPFVIPSGINTDGCPLASIDQGWDGRGVRRGSTGKGRGSEP